jgi:hypothetical protein
MKIQISLWDKFLPALHPGRQRRRQVRLFPGRYRRRRVRLFPGRYRRRRVRLFVPQPGLPSILRVIFGSPTPGTTASLEFTPPYTQGASLVIGQASLTQNKCITSATGLCQPRGIAFDSFGNLWIADMQSNRVLEYLQPFSSGQTAKFVLGQTNMTNGGYNQGYDFTQWNAFANPTGLAFDTAGDLWVSDNQNDRVLEFIPTSSGMGTNIFSEFPNLVIGQMLCIRGIFSAAAIAWIIASPNRHRYVCRTRCCSTIPEIYT